MSENRLNAKAKYSMQMQNTQFGSKIKNAKKFQKTFLNTH